MKLNDWLNIWLNKYAKLTAKLRYKTDSRQMSGAFDMTFFLWLGHVTKTLLLYL